MTEFLQIYFPVINYICLYQSINIFITLPLSPNTLSLSLSLYIYIYIFMYGGVRGVMATVVGNEYSNQSSNPIYVCVCVCGEREREREREREIERKN